MTKKQRILLFLKKNGRSSTTSISFAIMSSINYTLKYLNELAGDGKVKKEQETFGCYWEILNVKEA